MTIAIHHHWPLQFINGDQWSAIQMVGHKNFFMVHRPWKRFLKPYNYIVIRLVSRWWFNIAVIFTWHFALLLIYIGVDTLKLGGYGVLLFRSDLCVHEVGRPCYGGLLRSYTMKVRPYKMELIYDLVLFFTINEKWSFSCWPNHC